ncbi:hypothetical protein QBC37DRAFT_405019 [Rhypophila decipiens]|uniref:Uncharacterized protein n=1 Tax=Rhypophila decipiens TaxID=261697 RepID=A0AAN6Y013_9PEZI|nr:hypothetical protein QBC37DRAFT_405019 [Rhypophila decipiens]
MQFFIIATAALGLVANANALLFEVSPNLAVEASLAEPVAAAAVDKRQSNRLSTVDLFSSSGCGNYETTVITSGGAPQNGKCFLFSRTVPSVRTTFLRGGCTVTVYTDSNCSNGARAAVDQKELEEPESGRVLSIMCFC